MTLEQINKMSKADMVAALVEIGVAKWGEAERAAYEEMYRPKDEVSLRCNLALAYGIKEKVKGERFGGKIAAHCLDGGAS